MIRSVMKSMVPLELISSSWQDEGMTMMPELVYAPVQMFPILTA